MGEEATWTKLGDDVHKAQFRLEHSSIMRSWDIIILMSLRNIKTGR